MFQADMGGSQSDSSINKFQYSRLIAICTTNRTLEQHYLTSVSAGKRGRGYHVPQPFTSIVHQWQPLSGEPKGKGYEMIDGPRAET